MDIRPLNDQVIVRRLKNPDKTKGGVFIPDSVQEKSIEAEVLAVGRGTRDKYGEYHRLSVRVGDHVLIAKWQNNEIKREGEEFIIMKEADIFCVVER